MDSEESNHNERVCNGIRGSRMGGYERGLQHRTRDARKTEGKNDDQKN